MIRPRPGPPLPVPPAPTARPAALPEGTPPVLTVVIDTEEEFDWSRPVSRRATAVTATAEQPRLHEAVFAPLGLVPAYAVDYPVAATPAAARVLRALADEGACVIGTHLHPWVTPPHAETVDAWHSYHGNLSHGLEGAKLDTMTEAVADAFGRRPRLFKAGRYGLGPNTLPLLAARGYAIDASCVPYTTFADDGGPDFRACRPDPWWVEAGGAGPILELPVTTGLAGLLGQRGEPLYRRASTPRGLRLRLPGVLARGGVVERIRLTPEGVTLPEMQRLTRALLGQGTRVFSLTWHSPSVKPGCTPYVRTEEERDAFVARIGAYCRWFRDAMGGIFRTPEEILALCTAPVRAERSEHGAAAE